MSNKVITLIYEKRTGSAYRKAILGYCADRASDDGSGIWCSKGTIAAETEIARSTVIKTVNDLVAEGLLEVTGTRKCTNGATVEYRINLDRVAELEDVQRPEARPAKAADPSGSRTSPGADQSGSRTPPVRQPDGKVSGSRTQTLQKPSLNQQQERASAEDDGFEDFMDELRETVGVPSGPDAPAWWQGEPAQRHVRGWLDGLGLSQAQVLAAAAGSRQHFADPPDGPKGLDRAMQRAAAAQRPAAQGRRRSVAPVASEAERLAFLADWVNGERYLPPNAVSTAQASALISAGLVTPDRLRHRGVR